MMNEHDEPEMTTSAPAVTPPPAPIESVPAQPDAILVTPFKNFLAFLTPEQAAACGDFEAAGPVFNVTRWRGGKPATIGWLATTDNQVIQLVRMGFPLSHCWSQPELERVLPGAGQMTSPQMAEAALVLAEKLAGMRVPLPDAAMKLLETVVQGLHSLLTLNVLAHGNALAGATPDDLAKIEAYSRQVMAAAKVSLDTQQPLRADLLLVPAPAKDAAPEVISPVPEPPAPPAGEPHVGQYL